MHPPNLSKEKEGFNASLFSNERSKKKALSILGYEVSFYNARAEPRSILSFQKDYNSCGKDFSGWGSLKEDGKLGPHTLNALEVALRWQKNQGPKSWANLCKRSSDPNHISGKSFLEEGPLEETRYVEICPENGHASLRSMCGDEPLAVEVLGFEKRGDIAFAVVRIMHQASCHGLSQEMCFPVEFRS